MSVSHERDLELDDLPIDVFDLDDTGLTVESLTDGHGMVELVSSGVCACPCQCSCVQP